MEIPTECMKLKSSDPEYFKVYQRELYKTKLGQKCKCEFCGAIVTVRWMTKHKKSNKCKTRPMQDDERREELLAQLVKLLL